MDYMKAEVIPVGKMFTCEREVVFPTSLELPDSVKKSKQFSVLKVNQVGDKCEYVKAGDVVFLKPLAK